MAPLQCRTPRLPGPLSWHSPALITHTHRHTCVHIHTHIHIHAHVCTHTDTNTLTLVHTPTYTLRAEPTATLYTPAFSKAMEGRDELVRPAANERKTAEAKARAAGPVVSGGVVVERAVGWLQVAIAGEAFGVSSDVEEGMERDSERVGGGLKRGRAQVSPGPGEAFISCRSGARLCPCRAAS